MNFVTRLAIIEQIAENGAGESNGRPDSVPFRRPVVEGQRLIDELDRAQMLKAASYLRPAPDVTA